MIFEKAPLASLRTERPLTPFQVHAVTFGGDRQNTKDRQSIAFFLHPDDDYMVRCLDGNNKYPPISGKEYLRERMYASFTKYFGQEEA